ncbi:response regulator transcription factor [Bifidobacterium simiiventris]|uniref:response regulator transcription factor n=1 Tax=Bifidobacterium simiiventris TaxID=2834434 RepID=UPI001C568C0C|nr:response regulator transcription factor [Bifidobacterium simiiventris]MBW3078090.1 response regulator transcription factor [Bifidobacterium simiiventris]
MTAMPGRMPYVSRLDDMEQYAQHRSVSIAMVDNDRMALMALSSLLTRAGFTVMWTAQLGAAAIQRCIRAQDRPNVLLVDMALSDMTGVDVCQAVRKWAPELPMIGVTAYDPAVYRDAAIAAGAADVISKDDIPTIAATVRRLSASRQSDPAPASSAQPERSFALSAQQAAIMRMYADGRSTDEIAATLGISKGTIFSQVARVRDKLHARDRDEAVALCRRYLRM